MLLEQGRLDTLRLEEQSEETTSSSTSESRGRNKWAFRGLLSAGIGLSLVLLVAVSNQEPQRNKPLLPTIPTVSEVSLKTPGFGHWVTNPDTFSRVAALTNNPAVVIIGEKPLHTEGISLVNRSLDVIVALDLEGFKEWFNLQENKGELGFIFTGKGTDKSSLEGMSANYRIDVESLFVPSTRTNSIEALEAEAAINISSGIALAVHYNNTFDKEAASLALPHLDRLPPSHPARAIFNEYYYLFGNGMLKPLVKAVATNPMLTLKAITPISFN